MRHPYTPSQLYALVQQARAEQTSLTIDEQLIAGHCESYAEHIASGKIPSTAKHLTPLGEACRVLAGLPEHDIDTGRIER